MSFKNLILYHSSNFDKTVGGSESYSGYILKFFDGILKLYISGIKKSSSINNYLKKNYDIVINNTIYPAPVFKKGLYINCSINSNISRHRDSIHIVHFPKDCVIKFRKNLFKLAVTFVRKIFYYRSYSLFLCNSNFTAGCFKQMWKNVPCGKVKVLYPPVKLFSYNENSKRENIIVIFSRISYEKNIDILVETFNKHYSGQGLKLCILGSVNTKENQDYLEILKSKAANNITFVINPSRDTIQNIFDRALIFWHSMGYGKTDNFFFEHFGITTVEAMSSGLIPIVINKGGQSEIVDHYTNGFKWDSLEELIYFTNYFLKLTLDEKKMLSKKAVQKASCFSYEKFKLNFNAIILDYFKERLYET